MFLTLPVSQSPGMLAAQPWSAGHLPTIKQEPKRLEFCPPKPLDLLGFSAEDKDSAILASAGGWKGLCKCVVLTATYLSFGFRHQQE